MAMANRGNSFLSGFTGGMGAMTNMIGARDQRNYNAQKMAWMKEDRALQEQQRKDQQAINKTMASYELYRDMNKDQKAELEQSSIDLYNKNPQIIESLNRNAKEGEFKNISGMYSAPNGIGFNIDVRDANGKIIRNGRLTEQGLSDGSDRDMVIPMRDYLATLGRNEGLVSDTNLNAANIVARGGKLSKKAKDKLKSYSHETQDGNKVFIEEGEDGQFYKSVIDSTGRYTPPQLQRKKAGGGGSVTDRMNASAGIETPSPDSNQNPTPSGNKTQQPNPKSESNEPPKVGMAERVNQFIAQEQTRQRKKNEIKANENTQSGGFGYGQRVSQKSLSEVFGGMRQEGLEKQAEADTTKQTRKQRQADAMSAFRPATRNEKPVVAGIAPANDQKKIIEEARAIADKGGEPAVREYLSQYGDDTIRQIVKKMYLSKE